MDKAAMIATIMNEAKSAAIIEGKYCDTTDIFFSLAFMPEPQLAALCKAMRVKVNPLLTTPIGSACDPV